MSNIEQGISNVEGRSKISRHKAAGSPHGSQRERAASNHRKEPRTAASASERVSGPATQPRGQSSSKSQTKEHVGWSAYSLAGLAAVRGSLRSRLSHDSAGTHGFIFATGISNVEVKARGKRIQNASEFDS